MVRVTLAIRAAVPWSFADHAPWCWKSCQRGVGAEEEKLKGSDEAAEAADKDPRQARR
jgi:hypothetical protein